MRRGQFVLDRFALAAGFPRGPAETGTVALSARGMGGELAAEAELAIRAPYDIRLRPIELRAIGSGDERESGADAPRREPGRIRYDPDAREFELKSVRIIGALGDVELQAQVRDRDGTFAVDGRWMEPPALLRQLLRIPDAAWDSLRARWALEAPFHASIEGASRASERGIRIDATGTLHLPGPATLQPLLGSRSGLDSLGALDASVDFGLLSSAQGPEWSAEVDLTPTQWLRATPLRARGTANEVTLEHAAIGLEDVDLEFEASRRDSMWDARARLRVAGTSALERFVPALRADSLRLDASLSLQGTANDPGIELALEAGADRDTWHVPRLRGNLDRRHGRWSAAITIPEGLVGPYPVFALDSLRLRFESLPAAEGALPGRVELELQGPRLALSTRATIAREAGLEIRADTLGLALQGRDLRSSQPFEIRLREGDSIIELRDLALEGTLGRLRASGSMAADRVDLDAELTLALGGVPLVPGLPEGVWPQALELTLQGEGRRAVRATGSVEDFALGGRTKLAARIDALADTSGATVTVRLLDGPEEILEGTVQLHDVWSAPTNVPRDAAFDALVELQRFPVPWELLGQAGNSIPPATLDARATASGDLLHPLADLDLELRVPVEGAPEARVRAVAAYRPASSPASGRGDSIPESLRTLLQGLGGEGLAATIDLARGERTDLEGRLAIPVRILAGAKVAIDDSLPLRIQVSAPKLDLAEWSPLVPGGLSLQGRISSTLDLEGTPRDPNLRGQVSVEDLALSSPKGARATGGGNIQLEGTTRRPNIRGALEVTSALIPIPDNPRKLLPVEGEALLLEGQAGASDSVGVASPPAAAASTAPGSARAEKSAVQPEMDVEVVVPSSCWIRGRNLAVELGGKLRLQQQDGKPRVTGALDARQGTLTMLGRTFQLERGRVEFFGDNAENPSLDVALTTKVSSTTVRILVTGTAQKPEVELTSEPTLSQTDILSLLVFGRQPEDLGGDELELVAQRSAAMAATWGAAELQSSLSGVGVDLFSLNPASSPEGQSSVVVGKYLNERTLLKYEQALDNTTGFFVTLEYTLTRDFKFQTLAGTWQSGAEINWSKDY